MLGSFDCSFSASFDVDPTCTGGGDIFACLSACDLTGDPFESCCL